MQQDATFAQIELTMQQADAAAVAFSKCTLAERAALLKRIATQLESNRDELIATAEKETNLLPARLHSELTRTIYQLTSYGEHCVSGQWMDIRIDTALPQRAPPKPDLRKTMIPLGPVVVFGAGNFPFAYSTAGGDTACALAAGCPVVVKAHPAHAATSELVARLISLTVVSMNLHPGVFAHVHGASSAVGEALVKHPVTKAVGFTGSFVGGKQLFDWGNQRKIPIPVFAEMSSVNPVFILPQKLKKSAPDAARMLCGSMTLSVGQFCTSPGVIVALDNPDLSTFTDELIGELKKVPPVKMLHKGIAKNFSDRRNVVLNEKNVSKLYSVQAEDADELTGTPTLAAVTARSFIANHLLQGEVFGPYAIIVRCGSIAEMQEVASALEGQLTCTLLATDEEIIEHEKLVDSVRAVCGRLILNGVPTGVEVALAMHHGGPFPSTTDSRFTSVGADGIKRFARPITYQNWPDHLLPEELRNDNPLGTWRTINDQLSNGKVAFNE